MPMGTLPMGTNRESEFCHFYIVYILAFRFTIIKDNSFVSMRICSLCEITRLIDIVLNGDRSDCDVMNLSLVNEARAYIL